LTGRQIRGRPDRSPFAQEVQVNVPEERYQEIASTIFSEDSPVGIDAKKTHVMILYMLEQIDRRVARIEEQLRIAQT
jgi:hypothetical protein